MSICRFRALLILVGEHSSALSTLAMICWRTFPPLYLLIRDAKPPRTRRQLEVGHDKAGPEWSSRNQRRRGMRWNWPVQTESLLTCWIMAALPLGMYTWHTLLQLPVNIDYYFQKFSSENIDSLYVLCATVLEWLMKKFLLEIQLTGGKTPSGNALET